MASSAKRKTTMAKRDRENRLRERRMEKKAKKDARKLAAAQGEVTPVDDVDDAAEELAPED